MNIYSLCSCLFIVLIVVLFCLHFSDSPTNNENKSIDNNENKSIDNNEKKLNLGPFTSCKCKELQTWHPGQVEHMMKCVKFWSLNPGRTKEELLKVEGFS